MGVNGIYGLSGSGLDIESMVKAGMLSKQNQYDKMYQKEVKNEWKKEGYNEIYTMLNTFKYSTLSDYKMQSNMSAMKASSSDSSVVSVTANGAAIAMTHNVQVNHLSSNAYLLTGDEGIERASGKSDSFALKDIMFKSIEEVDDENLDDEAKEFYKGFYKVTLATGETMMCRKDTEALSFVISDSADSLTADQRNKQTIKYTFEDIINGKTLNDLAADIRATGTNIQASYDSTNDTFSLYNSESGKDAKISLQLAPYHEFEFPDDVEPDPNLFSAAKITATFLNNLHLYQSEYGELSENAIDFSANVEANTATVISGSDGEVVIDGRTYNDVKDNRVTVSGVTYTLLNVSEAGKKTTVSVTQDTDTIIDYVKKFVEDYNKILDDLQSKYSEKADSDYAPLSKTQEASMTQEQIDKWTEKAKAGLFYHDSILRDIIFDMREAVSTPVQSVNSSYNSAAAIGITTSDTKGHLTLDLDKLKVALAADPDCVYQIFASDQDNYSTMDPNKRQDFVKKDDYNNTGIANRLYFSVMTDGISTITKYAGVSADKDDQSTLGLLLKSLNDKMTAFKQQMDDYQTKLYKRYDALEVMISRLNTQFNTIFGGMNGGN